MKIFVVALDNPESIRTWSGVPYRIVRELRRLGHHVICRNYSNVWWITPIRVIYNRIICRLAPRIRCRSFIATRLGVWLNSLWLKREVHRAGNVELVIAMSFYFNGAGLGCKLVLVHDWTIGYLQALFAEKELTVSDENLDKTAFDAMRTAWKVIALYPKSAMYLRKHIGAKAHYICNPVNVDGESDVEGRIIGALSARHILVVGGATYRANLQTVIAAVEKLNSDTLEVDVVGYQDVGCASGKVKVNCYGYLNRSNPNDNDIYESLFRRARCFVNVRRGWCGGSSIAEALYRGVPVVASRNTEIQHIYGACSGISLLPPEDVDALAMQLKRIFEMREDVYANMCRQAYGFVRGDTYRKFVNDMLSVEGEAAL